MKKFLIAACVIALCGFVYSDYRGSQSAKQLASAGLDGECCGEAGDCSKCPKSECSVSGACPESKTDAKAECTSKSDKDKDATSIEDKPSVGSGHVVMTLPDGREIVEFDSTCKKNCCTTGLPGAGQTMQKLMPMSPDTLVAIKLDETQEQKFASLMKECGGLECQDTAKANVLAGTAELLTEEQVEIWKTACVKAGENFPLGALVKEKAEANL